MAEANPYVIGKCLDGVPYTVAGHHQRIPFKNPRVPVNAVPHLASGVRRVNLRHAAASGV